MSRRLLALIISSTLIANYLDATAVTEVMKHNIGAYQWEDEEWPNEPFGEYLNRCMKYQAEMQPFKKCKAAWIFLSAIINRAICYQATMLLVTIANLAKRAIITRRKR